MRILQSPDFYPRSPCGERPAVIKNSTAFSVFLSTLSLRRATVQRGPGPHERGHFYPRSPCGERLDVPGWILGEDNISIHALLAESDYIPLAVADLSKRFLSTLSLRRATHEALHRGWLLPISIHALLAESDRMGASTTFPA